MSAPAKRPAPDGDDQARKKQRGLRLHMPTISVSHTFGTQKRSEFNERTAECLRRNHPGLTAENMDAAIVIIWIVNVSKDKDMDFHVPDIADIRKCVGYSETALNTLARRAFKSRKFIEMYNIGTGWGISCIIGHLPFLIRAVNPSPQSALSYVARKHHLIR
jgi:hypothetical protein